MSDDQSRLEREVNNLVPTAHPLIFRLGNGFLLRSPWDLEWPILIPAEDPDHPKIQHYLEAKTEESR